MQIFNQACDAVSLHPHVVEMLRNLYTEPHRFYHNIDHIEHLLTLAEAEGKYDGNMIRTILYHDAVYYPLSKYNEELSAAFYFAYDNDHSARDISEIQSAIIASKNHLDDDNEYAPIWMQHFLDYDLAGLAEAKSFDINSVKIYREFMPFVTFDQFVEGRKAFFVKMLSHKRLYWKHPQWEQAARDNIYRELSKMENPEEYRNELDATIVNMIDNEHSVG